MYAKILEIPGPVTAIAGSVPVGEEKSWFPFSGQVNVGWWFDGQSFTVLSQQDTTSEMTPDQKAAKEVCDLLLKGINISSNSATDIDGNYAAVNYSISLLSYCLLYVLMNNAFPGNKGTIMWPDSSGVLHEFKDINMFKEFGSSIMEFFIESNLYRNTYSVGYELPSNFKTIG